jgi:hypothetical protein
MKSPLLLTILIALTSLAGGCTNAYTVTLVDGNRQPLADMPVTVSAIEAYSYLDIRHMLGRCITFHPYDGVTAPDGDIDFVINSDWPVTKIVVDERWVYHPYDVCSDFHPMRTQEEINADTPASQLPPLPDRPWVKFGPKLIP